MFSVLERGEKRKGEERGVKRKGTGKMLRRETESNRGSGDPLLECAHMILTVWVGVKLAIPKE